MTARSAAVLGVFILIAALAHVGLRSVLPRSGPTLPRSGPKPLHVGYVQGDIIYRMDPNRTSRYKVNGCKVECYENLVVVYVDKAKEPTWTDNYVLTIPWPQVESMTLMPER